MRQLQTTYTNNLDLSNTFKRWRGILKDRSGHAVAHVFIRFDSDNSNRFTYEIIRKIFEEELPGVPFVGGSSSGQIYYGNITDEDVVITLTVFDDPSTEVHVFDEVFHNFVSGQGRQRMRERLHQIPDIRGIEVISSSVHEEVLEISDELNIIDDDIEVFGGVTVGDEGHAAVSFTNTAGPSTNHVAIVIYSGANLHIKTNLINGWRPIGFPVHVTRSEKNILYELDYEPAFDVYNHYLHIPNDKNFFYNALEFPFQVTTPDSRVYLRHAKSSNEKGAIVMSAPVPKGSVLRMSYGDPNTIRREALMSAQEMRMFCPDGMLVITCLGRRLFWGEEANSDIRGFSDISGMLGFCALGEILRRHGKTVLNNLACVVVAMREGEIQKEQEMRYDTPADGEHSEGIISLASRLASFINTMTEEMMEANNRLQELLVRATVDDLTQIFNRGETERRLKRMVEIINQTKGAECAIVMGDVDDFKQINDTYSHQEGDNVLSCVAEIMKDVLQDELSDGVVGRWGGEEFMILLPRTSLNRAKHIAERICREVRNFDFEKHEPVTMSFGVTEYIPGERLSEFTSRVDENLYYSKEHGKDQVRGV
ncbi:MAG: GGDEF domain-containing protein [Lachnospiraceae bacterium]|nr:GGDEF domain-containing protein [Lachnospiraceae bacterium]